eukprot:CAMPEP_0119509432 /NCGR_PEP_ID=MMETSP1344-20130328/28724_1 /TAXON_ID=236787 /ORGANISM="Florenciella parvula, Strain CCMP2471" /LENGTH=69 /DNA_ID=CAMNT_0007546259 /DNA_START=34 /DNA_END=239 /DNA_ORIENTATION=+
MVLKQRTALLTGVSVERQKLIFKGVLDDAQLVSGTALTDNSKVMMLPRPASSISGAFSGVAGSDKGHGG